MYQQPKPPTDHDGTLLLKVVENFSEEIEYKILSFEPKNNIQENVVSSVKSGFDELHAFLKDIEHSLLEAAKLESEEALKSQETFVKEARSFAESVNTLQDEIKQSLPISDPITINRYQRKLEVMSAQFEGILSKPFEPEFIRDMKESRIISGLRVGRIQRKACFPIDTEVTTEDCSHLLPELKITGPESFSTHRQEVDMKESIISSFVWENGRIVVTDKSNRKLKIFTDQGKFLFDILFSNAEPYCVAVIDNRNQVDTFAVTFPKAKYIYFVSFDGKEITKPPAILSYFATEVGYSGVARGSLENSIFGTVVSNSGEPRVDLLDVRGKTLRTFNSDEFRRPLFSFPRYILVNDKTVIVSDHKMNAVIFLDFHGKVHGKYVGFQGQQLINPYDITCDGEGNVYVIDGRTGDIHVFDKMLRIISVIRSGSSLLNPRLLKYDIQTNRLAITHGAGMVTVYPVKSNYTIEEFETEHIAGHSDPLRTGDTCWSPGTHSAGSEGLLLFPQDAERAPSPGF